MKTSAICDEKKLHIPAPKRTTCRFCFSADHSNNHEKEPWNEILFQTDNFVVFPSLGMLVEGWLLITSKNHFISMGSMSHDMKNEMLDLKQQVNKWLSDCYQTPTVFEHGPVHEGLSVGCGVDHAHMHLVPLNFSLINDACQSEEFFGCTWQTAESFYTDTKYLLHQQNSYIYIAEPNGKSIFSNPDEIPCQSIRRIIARKLNLESKYDYNKHFFMDNIIRTKSVISNYLNNLRS